MAYPQAPKALRAAVIAALFATLLTGLLSTPKAEQGVEYLNGEISADYSVQDGNDVRSWDTGARLTAPLGGMWGVYGNAGIGRSRDSSPGFLDRSTDSGLGGGVFLRDPGVGKLSVGYDYLRSDRRFWFSGSTAGTAKADSYASLYGVSGSVYLLRASLGASYNWVRGTNEYNYNVQNLVGPSRSKSSYRLEGSDFSLRLYPSVDWAVEGVMTRLRARVDGAGAWSEGIDSVYLRTEYRLPIAGGRWGLNATLSGLGRDEDERTYALGISYHFDSAPSLIDRDRKLR